MTEIIGAVTMNISISVAIDVTAKVDEKRLIYDPICA